jgi:hypothetical protein
MNSTEQTTWQASIAEAARPTLETNGVGAVIVGIGPHGSEYLSRFYSHADPVKLRSIMWGRWARLFDEDSEGGSYYVVNHYSDGSLIVWNGMHSILWEA